MSLGANFQIGRSALAAYEAAISIAGQNIANLGNSDYTRQSGRLTALTAGPIYGQVRPGGGVYLSQLKRHADAALEARLRTAMGNQAGSLALHGALSQTEALYSELTEQDVSTQLSEFFAQFSSLETAPEDGSARNLVINTADALVRSLGRLRSGLIQQVEDLNSTAAAAAESAGRIAEEIASLNARVVEQESDGVTVASALRDRRDGLLRDLGTLMDIQVREQDTGAINVYVGSEPLVMFDRSRGPIVETELQDGLEYAVVRFADTHARMNISGGQLSGLLEGRDRYIKDQLDRLDTLARGIIYEVNRIHSSGVGLVGYESLLGTYAVDDPDAALNGTDANLTYPLQNGTFIVHVRDQLTGSEITRQVHVDLDGLNGDDTTITTLAAALDAVSGISASVTSDNRLQIDADSGQEIWFSEDSSGALAALGVGTFFTGENAGDMAINDTILQDPRLLAASMAGTTADGANAGRVAALALGTSTSTLLGNRSIQDYHEAIIGDLAIEAAGALTDYEAATTVHESLVAQRESVSGVSLDEEVINLTKYERAYQGAARYLGVVEMLTNEVMGLLR